MHVRIVNTGGSAVRLHAGSIPWLEASAMRLTAVEDTFESLPLTRAIPAGHPGPHVLTLEPQQSVEGDVRVDEHFPAIREILAGTDVIVYWSIRLEPLDAPPPHRFLGGVVFESIPAVSR